MRGSTRLALVFLACIAAAIVSCQKAETDEAAIRALVENDNTYFKSSTAGDSTENAPALDDTTVGLWWRGAQTHDQNPVIDVGIEEDSAWVGWHQHNYGELFHWVKTSGTTAELWTKSLTEKVQLNAVFMREGETTAPNRGWKLKKISLADGVSDTVNTVTIDSMNIHSSLRDVTIIDPLKTYYPVDSFVSFTPGEQLTLTLYTNVDEGFAFLHAFWGLLPVRIPFESEGGGVFVGTWNAQIIPGFRFAIFDLLSEGTLLGPTAPYDYKGWLFPYMIKTAD